MKFFGRAGAAIAAVGTLLTQGALAQAPPVSWTSPSGVTYQTFSRGNYIRWGYKLPADILEVDATEFIGFFECATETPGQGWCGTAVGGMMPNNLLLLAYANDDEVHTTFMYSSSHENAEQYAGTGAELRQIASHVNDTHFSIEYRCIGCMSWNHNGDTGSLSTTEGFMMYGHAHSFDAPSGDLDCPSSISVEQHDNFFVFGIGFTPEWLSTDYDEAAALATIIPETECGGGTPTTTSSVPSSSATEEPEPPETGIPVPDETFDYVIIGAGAGGIPVADKLSEAGHKVLLIERGHPSTDEWNGFMKSPWMEGTGLTRFDVPGFCNEIWHDSASISCRDVDQMAGCILGGGTAINAALWWRPYAADWDYNFPNGWKANDIRGAEQRVFSRIPGTTTPSQDGQRYLTAGMNTIRQGLQASGWRDTDLNANPNQKNRTFGYTPYMFANGERGGPLATYLRTANARSNFNMYLRTDVRRLVRTGGHVTGIEVQPYHEGGYSGIVKLKPETGRVILSAGTFGSARILMRSGIGPEDQLWVVGNSTLDGDTMISSNQWIKLPVGYNLEDHTNTDIVVRHPSVQFYDFYEAYDGGPEYQADIQAYLNGRTGILAQSAPNIGPLFFDEVRSPDGVVRQMQYTARMEGSLGEEDEDLITISQYLGRGAKSRGRMTLQNSLTTQVTQANHPYLRDNNDREAVIRSLENLHRQLSANIPGLEFLHPRPGLSVRDYVEQYPTSPATRRANHWIGTAKMSNSDGRSGGDGVVDTNTRVYGTDNLFVVDASIFPGHVTTNPSSYIVVAAEHAAQKIMQLGTARASREWEQCGGREWRGSFQCVAPFRCVELNPYYHQCQR